MNKKIAKKMLLFWAGNYAGLLYIILWKALGFLGMFLAVLFGIFFTYLITRDLLDK